MYLSNPPRGYMSHYLQIILPLICELLCGTRGLSRPAAAADSITGSGSPPRAAGLLRHIVLLFLIRA